MRSIIILSTLTILLLASSAIAQTRGAVAITTTSNSNLGDKQAAIGGLGTVEYRKARFGLSATGTFGQIKKNFGGSGFQGSGELSGRYFHKDFFVSGGFNAGGYSVRSFSKSSAAVMAGVGVQKPLYTLSGDFGHDISGVTRRNVVRGRIQAWTPRHFYFDAQVGVIRFTQGHSQTGASVRIGFGWWFGG